jgi:hypothetical protein
MQIRKCLIVLLGFVAFTFGCASNPERISTRTDVMVASASFKLIDQRPADDRESKETRTGEASEKVLGDDAIVPTSIRWLESALSRTDSAALSGRTLVVKSLQVKSWVLSPSVDARETYSAAGVGPAGPALAGALIYGFRLAKTRPTIYVKATLAEGQREFRTVFARVDVGFGGNTSDALVEAMNNAAKQLVEAMKAEPPVTN